ncbi:hypothetical protein GQ42DRAFT_181451 [Ramicandelaber brevisporus]|nr:hypothetical protein GQ42DRAFT_181451 [Ramicandelaber brevisporus]
MLVNLRKSVATSTRSPGSLLRRFGNVSATSATSPSAAVAAFGASQASSSSSLSSSAATPQLPFAPKINSKAKRAADQTHTTKFAWVRYTLDSQNKPDFAKTQLPPEFNAHVRSQVLTLEELKAFIDGSTSPDVRIAMTNVYLDINRATLCDDVIQQLVEIVMSPSPSVIWSASQTAIGNYVLDTLLPRMTNSANHALGIRAAGLARRLPLVTSSFASAGSPSDLQQEYLLAMARCGQLNEAGVNLNGNAIGSVKRAELKLVNALAQAEDGDIQQVLSTLVDSAETDLNQAAQQLGFIDYNHAIIVMHVCAMSSSQYTTRFTRPVYSKYFSQRPNHQPKSDKLTAQISSSLENHLDKLKADGFILQHEHHLAIVLSRVFGYSHLPFEERLEGVQSAIHQVISDGLDLDTELCALWLWSGALHRPIRCSTKAVDRQRSHSMQILRNIMKLAPNVNWRSSELFLPLLLSGLHPQLVLNKSSDSSNIGNMYRLGNCSNRFPNTISLMRKARVPHSEDTFMAMLWGWSTLDQSKHSWKYSALHADWDALSKLGITRTREMYLQLLQMASQNNWFSCWALDVLRNELNSDIDGYNSDMDIAAALLECCAAASNIRAANQIMNDYLDTIGSSQPHSNIVDAYISAVIACGYRNTVTVARSIRADATSAADKSSNPNVSVILSTLKRLQQQRYNLDISQLELSWKTGMNWLRTLLVPMNSDSSSDLSRLSTSEANNSVVHSYRHQTIEEAILVFRAMLRKRESDGVLSDAAQWWRNAGLSKFSLNASLKTAFGHNSNNSGMVEQVKSNNSDLLKLTFDEQEPISLMLLFYARNGQLNLVTDTIINQFIPHICSSDEGINSKAINNILEATSLQRSKSPFEEKSRADAATMLRIMADLSVLGHINVANRAAGRLILFSTQHIVQRLSKEKDEIKWKNFVDEITASVNTYPEKKAQYDRFIEQMLGTMHITIRNK